MEREVEEACHVCVEEAGRVGGRRKEVRKGRRVRRRRTERDILRIKRRGFGGREGEGRRGRRLRSVLASSCEVL